MPKPHEVESYLSDKGIQFRRRGQKAELRVCPFCSGGDHNDRFTCVVYLDQEGGNFKCMRGSCDQSGSFWQFVEHHGDDPKEFYKDFQRPEVHPLKQPIKFKTEPVEPQKLTDTALKYLERRGFTNELLEQVALWCDEKGNINFGYYHKGECCMVKVRHPRKEKEKEIKAWQKWKSGLRTLWGLEDCDLSVPTMTVTFGEYDRMAVMQAGLQNVVSVPCGDSDLEWISVCWDELEKCESINLWIDNDESGRIALPKIADRLGKHKIRVVKTEYKDANNMLGNLLQSVGQEKAYEAIWEAVGNAEWYWTGDLIEVADIEDDDQCFEGYASGIKYLDELTGGFYFYRMTVHIGSTKHGKSEGVNQFVANALELGAKVCVWTGEDSPKDYKYKIGIHFAGYDGIEQRVSKTGTYYSHITTEYKARVDEYMRGRLYLLDRRAGITEDAIVENFELAHRRHGCDVFVIDNLMKVVATKEADNTNHRQIQVVNKFSDFTKSYRVHGHLVAHTNKSGPTDEPPDRRNVSGASEIVNLADTVLGWWRIPAEVQEKYDHRNAWLGVLANRAHGDEGAINLTYDKRVRRFTSTDAEFHRRYSL